MHFLLVDDHAAVLRTYQRILVQAGHSVVVATGLEGARALLLQTAEAGRLLDAVLLDLNLDDGDGADLLPGLHRLHPLAQVAVVSGHADAARVIELSARCALVVPKPLGCETLLALAEELQARRARAPSLEELAARAQLSPREIEVLQQTAAGRQNPEIAEELGCTVGSVKTYWSRIFKKTGCHSRAEVLGLIAQARGT